MVLAATRLGDDLRADQECDLDAGAGESDAGAASLGAGSDVVVPRELTPLHAVTVVHDRQRGRGRVRSNRDGRGAGVQGVGDDLGENGLLGGPGIGITEVLEKVEQIDPRLAHRSPYL